MTAQLTIDRPTYQDDIDAEAGYAASVLHNRLKRAIAKVLARSGVDAVTAEALAQRQANETVQVMGQWEWERVNAGGVGGEACEW